MLLLILFLQYRGIYGGGGGGTGLKLNVPCVT